MPSSGANFHIQGGGNDNPIAPTANRVSSLWQWVVTPIPPDTALPAKPVWPDFARAAARSPTHLAWVITPAQPDLKQPPGREVWPDLAPGARRGPTHWTHIVTPAQPDLIQPPAYPAWPDIARGRARAAEYPVLATYQPAIQNARSQIPPVYPDVAPGPRRASVTMYAGLMAGPVEPDLSNPSMPVYPDLARAPLRAPQTEYVTLSQFGTLQPPVISPPLRPVYADIARGAQRAAGQGYVALISAPALADLNQPVGEPYFPITITAAARTSPILYQMSVAPPPTGGDEIHRVRWPDIVQAPRRLPEYTVIVQAGDRRRQDAGCPPGLRRCGTELSPVAGRLHGHPDAGPAPVAGGEHQAGVLGHCTGPAACESVCVPGSACQPAAGWRFDRPAGDAAGRGARCEEAGGLHGHRQGSCAGPQDAGWDSHTPNQRPRSGTAIRTSILRTAVNSRSA